MSRVLASVLAIAAVFSQVSAAPTNYGSSSYGSSEGSSYGSSSEVAAASYGSSNSNYGSSNYGSSSYGSSSYGSSEKPMEDNSKNESVATTTTSEASSTSASWEQTQASSWGSSQSYGSGYKNWGGEGYNNCVQQCMAQYSAPAATYTAAASSETAESTGTPTSGSGTTHTVIVAPTQGVLRYVPFAVNASVGDTVRFVWGAGPHTVTKSSALNPCNNSLDANAFTSGKQNKSFVFDQVVNDTNPTFFYCTVPTHCQKGMFGIINPPNADVSSATPTNVTALSSAAATSMTVGQYVNTMAQNDSSMAALVTYVNNQTMGTSAYQWGMSMDMSSMPEAQYGAIAQNAMYSALFYASNPGMLEAGQGATDVTGKGIMIPADITQTLASLGSSSAASSDAPAYGAPDNAAASPSDSAAASTASVTALPKTNASGKLASSTVLVGAVAVLVSFIAL